MINILSLFNKALIIGMVALSFTMSNAQIPRTISYQGLIQQNGKPISGQHLLHIVLYDDIVSGNIVYEESHQVDVANGLFNIIIGSVTPIPNSVPFDKTYFLSFSIDGADEVSSRTQLTSTPYAISSHYAELAQGLTSNARGVVTSINELSGAVRLVGDSITKITSNGNELIIHAIGSGGGSGIQSVKSPDNTVAIANATGPDVSIGVADNSITSAKLAQGSVTLSKLNQNGATLGQILKWNGSNWVVSNDSTRNYQAGQGITITGNVISATGGFPAGTTANSTLRWNGTAWVENTNLTSDGGGNSKINGTATIGDGIGADNILLKPGSGNITVQGFSAGVIKSNPSGVLSSGMVDLSSEVSGILSVSHGGTGVASIPIGQIVVGNGVNPVTTATLTAGSGITITSLANVITIANTEFGSQWKLLGNAGINPVTNFLGTVDGNPLAVRTNNIERIRIDAAGNIGIGTTTPQQLLEIKNGNLLLSNTGTSGKILLGTPNSTNVTSFTTASQSNSINYILPNTIGTINQVLSVGSVAANTATLNWSNVIGGNEWLLTGNSTTTAGSNFLGTTDNQAFEIHIFNSDANNKGSKRVMRYEPNALSANIIGGHQANTITGGVSGATISGGGADLGSPTTFRNKVTGDFGTVSGGVGNSAYTYSTVGGGLTNTAAAQNAVVGGGQQNSANGVASVIGGGYLNVAAANGTVSGGGSNSADTYGTVGGGEDNTAGPNAVVGGGVGNSANGDGSVVAGGLGNNVGVASSIFGGNYLLMGDHSFGFNGTTTALSTNLSPKNQIGYFGDVNIWIGNDDNVARELRFYEGNNSYTYTGTNYSAIKSGTQSTDITYTLPTAQPTANQVLIASSIAGTGPYNVSLDWAANGGNGWLTTGNSGTGSTTNFLGTTDNQAFEIHIFNTDANNKGSKRVMRYEPNALSANIIGGFQANTVSAGVVGATISGGGADYGNPARFKNIITGDWGTVSGGLGNSAYIGGTVGGGEYNIAAQNSVVGGGIANNANGIASVICGGASNSVGDVSSIFGGNYLTLGNNSFGFNGAVVPPGIDISSKNQIGYFGDVNIWIGNDDNSPRELRFYEGNNSITYTGTNYSAFKAGTQTTDITYTLPTASPVANGNLLFASTGSSSTMNWSTGLVWDNTNSRLGINTSTPSHPLHSINSATTDEVAALFGVASASSTNQAIGVWGKANNTGTTNTGTIAVLATGNGNTTAGQTNIALQINDGELTMGRTTEAPGSGTLVVGATAGTTYTAEGPSGVVELTLGGAGNLVTAAPTASILQSLGTITINNRYCQSGSIVLLNIVNMTDDGVAPDPRDAAFILNVDNTATGSFSVRVKMIPALTNAANYTTNDKIRIGYVIVNKSK